MNNNLCIICGGYFYCSCTSGESQIPPAVLRMNIPRSETSFRACMRFPYWLGDSPWCSQLYHNRSRGAPVAVIRYPTYSEGRLECPLMVWFCPEIDASNFTLRLLSHTPGGSQWLKYILLMYPLQQHSFVCIWQRDQVPCFGRLQGIAADLYSFIDKCFHSFGNLFSFSRSFMRFSATSQRQLISKKWNLFPKMDPP